MGIAKWCGNDSRGNKIPYDDIPLIGERYRDIISEEHHTFDRLGFFKNFSDIKNNIIIPKYYDPEIETELSSLKHTHDLIRIGELRERNIISISTGVEIGKLSYGTGKIPFIRTSDISNWELKIDPKHGVNQEIFEMFNKKCDIREKDILMVRDGTYLIGTCSLVTKFDLGILFQSHIFKIRVKQLDKLSPYLLLALLNTPIVKKQIRAKQFTQDIIDTLGSRIFEIILPIPKDQTFRENIAKTVQRIIEQRAELRNEAHHISLEVIGKKEMSIEEKDLMEQI
jgi:type I restriction enzyme M protein